MLALPLDEVRDRMRLGAPRVYGVPADFAPSARSEHPGRRTLRGWTPCRLRGCGSPTVHNPGRAIGLDIPAAVDPSSFEATDFSCFELRKSCAEEPRGRRVEV